MYVRCPLRFPSFACTTRMFNLNLNSFVPTAGPWDLGVLEHRSIRFCGVRTRPRISGVTGQILTNFTFSGVRWGGSKGAAIIRGPQLTPGRTFASQFSVQLHILDADADADKSVSLSFNDTDSFYLNSVLDQKIRMSRTYQMIVFVLFWYNFTHI